MGFKFGLGLLSAFLSHSVLANEAFFKSVVVAKHSEDDVAIKFTFENQTYHFDLERAKDKYTEDAVVAFSSNHTHHKERKSTKAKHMFNNKMKTRMGTVTLHPNGTFYAGIFETNDGDLLSVTSEEMSIKHIKTEKGGRSLQVQDNYTPENCYPGSEIGRNMPIGVAIDKTYYDMSKGINPIQAAESSVAAVNQVYTKFFNLQVKLANLIVIDKAGTGIARYLPIQWSFGLIL